MKLDIYYFLAEINFDSEPIEKGPSLRVQVIIRRVKFSGMIIGACCLVQIGFCEFLKCRFDSLGRRENNLI